MYNLLCSILD